MDNNLAEKCMGITGVEVKDPDRGEVEAVVARTGIKDRDGDVFLAGAFGSRPVRVSAYNHASWPARGGLPPVGRGTIQERGNEVVFTGRFFLGTTAGREAFEVVKEMGDLQEWSFGWLPGAEQLADVTPEMRKLGTRRAIKAVPVEEVSPVLLGASFGTRTVAAKCERCSTTPTPAPSASKSPAATTPRGPRNVLMHDRAVVKLAGFAVDLAARLHGSEHPPAFTFFEPDGKSHGLAPVWPTLRGANIRLAANLRGADLVATVLHECRHVYEHEGKAAEEAERDAESFALQWTEPALRAFEATKGNARDLHVSRDREPPFYRGQGGRWRAGDLVLSARGRLWRYTPMNTRAWSPE